jgi:uncharacterized protein with HEPN domain
MRRDRERVLDILESIERIERYAPRGKEAFIGDELVRVWIIHHLQIIGEAMYKIPKDVRMNYTGLPWKRFLTLRNLLVHDYDQLDLEEIWRVVENDLSNLKSQAELVLQQMPDNEL